MIDVNKLSRQLNDTMIHRQFVMRSGTYLAKYLTYKKRDIDAIRLLLRCSEHDLSKLRNLDEFLALASIVDDIGNMSDISHRLTSDQKDAIRLHWKNNSHHPEHYASVNDMSELDIMEMACDCHARSKQYGTDLLEYIRIQQDLRFHFDEHHFNMLMAYARVLVVLTRKDDYSSLLSKQEDPTLKFSLNDSTFQMLNNFSEEKFANNYKTNRLVLNKVKNTDFATIVYEIYLFDGTLIGYVSLKCNGVLDYNIFVEYRGKDYEKEAIGKILEIATINGITCYVRKDEDRKESIRNLTL